MSVIYEVQEKLAVLIDSWVYPTVHRVPIFGAIKIYAGWPESLQLEEDLLNEISHISIYRLGEYERLSDSHGRQWIDLPHIPEAESGTAILTTKCQEHLYMISIWTYSPEKRSGLSELLDTELSFLKRIELKDQYGILVYKKQEQIEQNEKQQIFRHDLYYGVMTETLKKQDFPVILDVIPSVYVEDASV